MHTKCCAVLQRSRAKHDKIPTWVIRDSDLQQNWSRNEKSLREIGELVWKEGTHPSLFRKHHFQFLPESKSEIHRDQQCEHC